MNAPDKGDYRPAQSSVHPSTKISFATNGTGLAGTSFGRSLLPYRKMASAALQQSVRLSPVNAAIRQGSTVHLFQRPRQWHHSPQTPGVRVFLITPIESEVEVD
jgi:hypothetical protein